MIVRVKFSKYGLTKFIGHLDVVRYFQKAIRRSGLEVMYSEGFNPHQLLYFAAPLGLGQTSDAEYMDATLKREYPLEEIKERLNAVMAEGFYVQSVSRLSEWKPNQKKESIMSLTSCADYMVSVKDMEVGQDGVTKPYAEWFADIRESFPEWIGQDCIMVEKESKKSTRTVDLKPMIFAWGFTPETLYPDAGDPLMGIWHADTYENGIRLFFRLASGSVDNLKPELVMEEYCRSRGIPYQESALQFHRMETYCDLSLRNMNQEETRAAIDAGKNRREFVPLWKIN